MTNRKLDEWLQILAGLALPLPRALPAPARIRIQDSASLSQHSGHRNDPQPGKRMGR